MPLSNEDRERVLRMLDQLEAAEARRIIESYNSFQRWFRITLPEIFRKIADQLHRLWIWLKMAFR